VAPDAPPAPLARHASDLVASALGLNLWVSLVLVPGLFVGTFERHPALMLFAPLPLVALGVGILRRSPLWLLLTYPATLLLPVAVDARVVAENAQGPVTFTLVGISLVGYLLGAAYLTGAGSTHHAPSDAHVERIRRLSSADRVPNRWRRRTRIYVALAVLSAIFPAVLVYAVDFAPDTRAFLDKMYAEKASAMLALMNLGVLALWLGIYAIGFLAPLQHHRTGDRQLVRRLDELKQDARRGTPRLTFYVAVVAALGLMAVLIFSRYR
jgi:hypothetical protein